MHFEFCSLAVGDNAELRFDSFKRLLLICKSEISFQLQKEHQKLDAFTPDQNILKYLNLSKSSLL